MYHELNILHYSKSFGIPEIYFDSKIKIDIVIIEPCTLQTIFKVSQLLKQLVLSKYIRLKSIIMNIEKKNLLNYYHFM